MNISEQLDQMIANHRKVIKQKASGKEKKEFICPNCDNQVTNLVYKRQKNNTLHLCGVCPTHGWKYVPLVKGLDLPVVDRRLKTKRNKSGRRTVVEQEKLF